MAGPLENNSAEASSVRQRIADARLDRNYFAPTYNDFIQLACPWKHKISTHNVDHLPEGPDDQFEIFDATLQQAVDDFVSAEHDELTPEYKAWTRHEVAPLGRPALQQQAQEIVDARYERIYSRIRASAYKEIANELFSDLAIMPGMLNIPMVKAGEPLIVEYVPPNEILIEPGPRGGVDLRARERRVRVCDLDKLYPELDFSELGTDYNRKKNRNRTLIIEGCYRRWDKLEPTWIWFVECNGKIKYSRELEGEHAAPLLPIRTRVAAPTGYCVGPALKALAPARTLNQLAYDELYRIDRMLRPPLIYDQDRVFNPDGSLEPGRSYARRPGTKLEEMYPQGSAGEAFFKREELKLEIRRALYVDKPDQRGKTPPTKAQYMGEQAETQKRVVLHRARIQSELVLGMVNRVEWVMMRNGELEAPVIDGQAIQVRSVSALSRASDLESAQISMENLSFAAQVFGPEAMQGIVDPIQSMKNIIRRTGDENIEVLPEAPPQQEGPV